MCGDLPQIDLFFNNIRFAVNLVLNSWIHYSHVDVYEIQHIFEPLPVFCERVNVLAQSDSQIVA